MSVAAKAECVWCRKSYWELSKHFLMALSRNPSLKLPRYLKHYILSYVIQTCECPTCRICLICTDCLNNVKYGFICYNNEQHVCHICIKKDPLVLNTVNIFASASRCISCNIIICEDCSGGRQPRQCYSCRRHTIEKKKKNKKTT